VAAARTPPHFPLLTEDLRHHVLSYLPTADCARCAVLAKDWLYSVARIVNPTRTTHDHLCLMGWLSSTRIPREVGRMPGDITEILGAVWRLGTAFDLRPFEGIVREWLELADPHEDDMISVNEYGIANVVEFGVVGFRSDTKPGGKPKPFPDYIVVYIMGDPCGQLLGGGYYAGAGRHRRILHIQHTGVPFQPIVVHSDSKRNRVSTVQAIEALFLEGLDRHRTGALGEDIITLGDLRARGTIPAHLRRIRDVVPPCLALLHDSHTGLGRNAQGCSRRVPCGRQNSERKGQEGWASPVLGVLMAGALGLAAYLMDRSFRRALFR